MPFNKISSAIKNYVCWFEFAEKTRDQSNVSEDFESYVKDKTFLKIIERLNKTQLQEDDYSYLRYYYEWENIKGSVTKQAKKEGREEGSQEGLEEGKKEALLETATKLLKNGITPDLVAQSTDLSLEEIEQLQKRLLKNNGYLGLKE